MVTVVPIALLIMIIPSSMSIKHVLIARGSLQIVQNATTPQIINISIARTPAILLIHHITSKSPILNVLVAILPTLSTFQTLQNVFHIVPMALIITH